MPSTIRDLTELTVIAPDDYLLISDTSDVVNRDKRISRLNLIGGALTGGGSLITGGFNLTVPATGTAALLQTAQTFTGLKSFSAGLAVSSVAGSFYEEYPPWQPTLRFGGLSVGIAYSIRSGTATRIGNRMFCTMIMTLSSKGTSTGTADIAGLPLAPSLSAVNNVRWANMATAMYALFMVPSTGSLTIPLRAIIAASTAGGVAIADTDFTNTTNISAVISYDV